ncbi:MAG TPA: hypothetical protein VMR95_04575 [Candidatus Binatia bacterium]|nr:hypothetical protein [Candidatus Binatia bacterium]
MDNSEPNNSNLKRKSSSKDVVSMGSMLLSSLNKVRTLVEQGFVCGLLFVATISAAVYGYDKLASNGNAYGMPYLVWQISLLATAFILSLIVAIGLPILWGRRRGFKRVLGILSWEFILIAIAVLIAAFVLNGSSQANTVCPVIYQLNSSSNCFEPGGTILPSQQ